jgi:hypothetical protein
LLQENMWTFCSRVLATGSDFRLTSSVAET